MFHANDSGSSRSIPAGYLTSTARNACDSANSFRIFAGKRVSALRATSTTLPCQATHSAGEDWDWPPVRWPKAGTGTEVPADRLGLVWTENYKTDVLYSLETETVQGARDWRALRSWQSAGNPASGPDWPRDWHLDGRVRSLCG